MIHTEITGSGPRAVLLHGFTQTLESFAPILPAFTGRTVVAADLPGHGRSGPARPGFAENVDAIVAACGPGAYVGYSMGGRIALTAAVFHPEPVKQLVLISATPGIATYTDRVARSLQDLSLAKRLRAEGLDRFLEWWLSQPMFENLDDPGIEHRLQNTTAALATAAEHMGTGSMPSMWDRLSRVEIPVLVITGERDKKFCEIGEKVAALLPNGQHTVVSGAGHPVHLEQPDEVSAIISDFLSVHSPVR